MRGGRGYGEIYENSEDRVRQSRAVEIVRQNMRHRAIVETPELFRSNHDFVIYDLTGLKVGVGEVKCRNYPASFFVTHPWMFEAERIKVLKKQHEDVGFRVMLVLYTSDDKCFWVALSTLLKHKLDHAPDDMMKNDHGTKPSNRRGVLIPFELLNEIKEKP